jgi:hypothetical protein
MKTPTIILIAFVSIVFGQQADKKDVPKPPTQVAKVEAPAVPQFPKPLDEMTALKLENLQLKAQQAQAQIEQFTKDYSALISAKCSEQKLSPGECIIGKDNAGVWMVAKNTPQADKK